MTSYNQKNLVADIQGGALNLDSTLNFPWGMIVRRDTIWVTVTNANTPSIREYTKCGRLINTIPTVDGTSPTGIVDARCSNFNADFIVVTLSGTIEAYTPPATTTTIIFTPTGPSALTGVTIYKGLLYVANFGAGTVDVYAAGSPMLIPVPTKQLIDVGLQSANYNPFNVYSHCDKLYISFARITSSVFTTMTVGLGEGYVDIYYKGVLSRLINRGPLNAPWGMIRFKNTLFVANVGGGYISIFKIKEKKKYNCLKFKGIYCKPITTCCNYTLFIDNIHAIVVSECSDSSNRSNKENKNNIDDKIYFTAAPDPNFTGVLTAHGVVGVLKECKNECDDDTSSDDKDKYSSSSCSY